MKNLMFQLIIVSIISTVCTINAQPNSQVINVNSLPGLNPQLAPTVHASWSGKEELKVPDDKKTSGKKGIVSGIFMISGGAVLFAAGQILGDEAYDKYKKSAFTVNTDRLRQKVHLYNALRNTGGVIGGAGIIVLAFSF